MRLFSYYKSADCFWIRFGQSGYGLNFKRYPMLFSERNNSKYLKLPLGWRLALLKPNQWITNIPNGHSLLKPNQCIITTSNSNGYPFQTVDFHFRPNPKYLTNNFHQINNVTATTFELESVESDLISPETQKSMQEHYDEMKYLHAEFYIRKTKKFD